LNISKSNTHSSIESEHSHFELEVAQYVVRMQSALVVYSGAVEVLYKITWYYVE